jgi:hypothetical protein
MDFLVSMGAKRFFDGFLDQWKHFDDPIWNKILHSVFWIGFLSTKFGPKMASGKNVPGVVNNYQLP